MKTMTRMMALGVVGLSLAGCAQPDDAKVMIDDKGKAQTQGVTPPNAPRSSREAMERSGNQNERLSKNKAYQNTGR